MRKEKNKYIDTFTIYDKNYNYEDDDAEAVIYLINPSGKNLKPNLFVMKRKDAVKFCSRKETTILESIESLGFDEDEFLSLKRPKDNIKKFIKKYNEGFNIYE